MPYSTKANRRQAYGKKGNKMYKKIDKVKKMVTGEGPTMLEKIASGVGGVASVAKAVLPAIAAINTEEKFYDQSSTITAYNVQTNGQIFCITNLIAQGVQDNQRIGTSILAKQVNMRIYISNSFTVAQPFNIARFILFVWKDNATANAPTLAKLLQANDINSGYNKDYTDQFVVIKDKTMTFNAAFSASYSGEVKHLKVYKKLDFHMRWIGNGTTTQAQNHLYIAVLGAQTSVANAVSLSYYTRINYTDN